MIECVDDYLCVIQRTAKLIKSEKNLSTLAQNNPAAFFEEIKTRLLAYKTGTHDLSQSFHDQIKSRMIDEDSLAVLDLQIAKTIDDADSYLNETSVPYRNYFTRYDSGVGTDSSEK